MRGLVLFRERVMHSSTFFVEGGGGVRHSAAGWIDEGNENLRVKTEHVVERVLFDGKTAIGVEYTAVSKKKSKKGSKTAMLSKNGVVILAGGALETPRLLMLSGIGPQDTLSSLGIKPVLINNHIGSHLQDNPILPVSLLINKKIPLKSIGDIQYIS